MVLLNKITKALHLTLNTATNIVVLLFILYIVQYNIPTKLKNIVKDNTVKITILPLQQTEFEATGYANGAPYSTKTAAGNPVMNKGFMKIGDLDFFTIAVDPDIIPLGSVVWVYDKDGKTIGVGMATDTGRLIKGMKIDICFANMDEAMKFGRQKIKVARLK